MIRLLVLGANGFLGRSIAHHLAEESAGEVDLVVHTRRGGSPIADVEHHVLDVLDAAPGELGRLFDHIGPDAVLNCIGGVTGDPTEMRAANVEVVDRLVAALAGRRRVHLVHLGSAAEYGVQAPGVPVREDMFAAPTSGYGMTKLDGTKRLVAASRDGLVTATVLRAFNPIGRYSAITTLPGRAAAAVDDALRTSADAIVLGPLGAWRDYLDTRDVADAVLAACRARADGSAGDHVVFNIGRGEARQSRELVRLLCTAAGFDGRVDEARPASHRSSTVDWQAADVTLAARRLGWRATRDLDEAVREVWAGRCAADRAADRVG